MQAGSSTCGINCTLMLLEFPQRDVFLSPCRQSSYMMTKEWHKTEQTFQLSLLETQFCTIITAVSLVTCCWVLLPRTELHYFDCVLVCVTYMQYMYFFFFFEFIPQFHWFCSFQHFELDVKALYKYLVVCPYMYEILCLILFSKHTVGCQRKNTCYYFLNLLTYRKSALSKLHISKGVISNNVVQLGFWGFFLAFEKDSARVETSGH